MQTSAASSPGSQSHTAIYQSPWLPVETSASSHPAKTPDQGTGPNPEDFQASARSCSSTSVAVPCSMLRPGKSLAHFAKPRRDPMTECPKQLARQSEPLDLLVPTFPDRRVVPPAPLDAGVARN